MQLTSLITAAGLAVSTTSAFLLPLSDSSESDTITTLPVPFDTDFKIKVPQTAEAQTLELPCPGCPVPVGHHRGDGDKKAFRIKTDIPSHLDLSFTIDHGVDHDRLMLNDFELYPEPAPLRGTLGAQVQPDHKDDKHRLPGHRKQHKPFVQPLGYALGTLPVAKSEEDDLELVELNLQIIEVGNMFVDGVPTVEIRVIKTAEGGLLIGGIETKAAEALSETPMEKEKDECVTLLCKWKAMLASQMGRFSHKCGGRPHGAGKMDGGHRHPHGHGPHGHGPHGQHRHRFSHLLRNIAMHIIIPIAVGVAAGIIASVIGMVVGTAIVYLWRTFFRPAGARRHHHRRGHSTHKAQHVESAAADEKAGLMSHQEDDIEAPPAYIDETVENKST